MTAQLLRIIKVLLSIILTAIMANSGLCLTDLIRNPGAPAPSNLSIPEEKVMEQIAGDIYVSTNGNDENDGSFERPLATIEGARDKIRRIKTETGLPTGGLTVCVMAGEYNVNSLVFEDADSGEEGKPVVYRAYGDGEVILNGGLTLNADDFEPVKGEARDRLTLKVRKKVMQTDLTEYGLTAADWGKLYATGAFNTARKYDGDVVGAEACELFFNDSRMTLARYPNGDTYLKTGEIIDIGDCGEYPPQNYNPDWGNMRNPRGGTFKVGEKVNKKIKNWASIEDVWIFGYFYWDWADASMPVKSVDTAAGTLTTGHAAQYGFKEGALYYFYNVLEELDAPGEWYLDRNTGILYLYPPAEMTGAEISLSVTEQSIIKVSGGEYLDFYGFGIKGSRADAVSIEGNYCTVKDCVISNCAGSGIVINGWGNRAERNEIMHMGKGGINLNGGERQSLSPGNNVADNNYIHNYGETYKTYYAGVNLGGVGNVCSHNEISEAPHMAVYYSGNDHLIEYNNIYSVVKQSSDAGAIYAGRDITAYGNIIRYNSICNIGSGEFTPSGIYFDDAIAGQTAFGNILINIPGNAFLIGGGRDLKVENNIIINARTPIWYDERAREGVVSQGWFKHHVENLDSGMWRGLLNSPYQTDIWKAKYPQLAKVSHDFNDTDNPYFAVNPAFSEVKNNIIVSKTPVVGMIYPSVYRFSTVRNNPAYCLTSNPGFVDFRGGNYLLKEDARVLKKVEVFNNLPFENIGRY